MSDKCTLCENDADQRLRIGGIGRSFALCDGCAPDYNSKPDFQRVLALCQDVDALLQKEKSTQPFAARWLSMEASFARPGERVLTPRDRADAEDLKKYGIRIRTIQSVERENQELRATVEKMSRELERTASAACVQEQWGEEFER